MFWISVGTSLLKYLWFNIRLYAMCLTNSTSLVCVCLVVNSGHKIVIFISLYYIFNNIFKHRVQGTSIVSLI